jgi:hypothetical protein
MNDCACYWAGFGTDEGDCAYCKQPRSTHSPEALALSTLPPVVPKSSAGIPVGPAVGLSRTQAELFANDISLIADGVQQFFQRVSADPALKGKPPEEIVVMIQATGALDHLMERMEEIAEFIAQTVGAGALH